MHTIFDGLKTQYSKITLKLFRFTKTNCNNRKNSNRIINVASSQLHLKYQKKYENENPMLFFLMENFLIKLESNTLNLILSHSYFIVFDIMIIYVS